MTNPGRPRGSVVAGPATRDCDEQSSNDLGFTVAKKRNLLSFKLQDIFEGASKIKAYLFFVSSLTSARLMMCLVRSLVGPIRSTSKASVYRDIIL